jgi:Domain of unknown function (DUF1707)
MWQEDVHSLDASARVWPRPDLRAGDEDRRQVVAELQRHYVEGRLTADELGERVAQASAARTFGELAATLSDLPATRETGVRTATFWGVPLQFVVLGLAVVALIALLFVPMLHMGLFPVWPLFIWGFFFFGRPGRGRRYH